MTERPLSKPQDSKLNKTAKAPVAPSQEAKVETKMENKTEVNSSVEDNSKTDNKEVKAEEKKKETPKLTKRTEASVNALSLPISKKHAMYICAFIKNKSIDVAIAELEDVIKFKRPIPMKGEIPHRSHPGMMSGRYPIKASKQFIQLLKGLKGNAIVNQMELDKTRIAIGNPSWASRPMMKGGAKFKRTNVKLVAKEIQPNKKMEKKQ